MSPSSNFLKKMELQKVLVTLSTLIFVAQADEESCSSTDKHPKVTQRSQTVRSHLRDSIHSVWKDGILEEQTKEVTAFFNKELNDRDSKINELTNAVNKLTNTVNEMKKEVQVRTN